MPIPKEILAVKRPVNTVVIAYGKRKDRYGVRQRVGCRNVNGRHLPVNGPTIGHIVDGKYIPLEAKASVQSGIREAPIDLKDWGNAVLCERVFSDMLAELREVYSPADAERIYCIAVLRVCNPGIRDRELKERYETSFLSELHPGVALSRNSVSQFLNQLGKACSRIARFMRNRAAKVHLDHHLLLDGTLKSDESRVNTLSDFSRKSKIRGTRDISVLYAFDLEAMEPICSQCFPGNMLDMTSYEAFISDNGITRGLIVADKGFPAGAAERHFAGHPDLHFLNPIKRNSKLIGTHGLSHPTGALPGFEGVTFRKEKCHGKAKWLYAFRDAGKAAKEEQEWLKRTGDAQEGFAESYAKKRESFGTIVLESDLDLAPETAYKAYAKRWEIEIVMRYYKTACQFDGTRVQDDYSVMGSELCDFLATILTFRLIGEFDRAELLKDQNYSRIMPILRRAKKVRLDGQDWQLVRINPSQRDIMQTLGLLPHPETPRKRNRGRPRKEGI